MASKAPMTERPPKPSAAARFVNQSLFPAAIDGASKLDRLLNTTAEATRARPVAACLSAFGLGLALRMLRGRRV